MKHIHLSLFGLILIPAFCAAEHRITFFVQTYPEINDEVAQEKVVRSATNPQHRINRILQNNPASKPFSGLFSTYAGYSTISTPFDGQISFPRKQQNPSFFLVVTPRIEPVIMLGATVHHWQLVNNVPVAFYGVDRKQDPDTKSYFWSVRKAEVPENGIVPLTSIVLFAKPKNIYVPLGITPTTDDPQLVLPTVYVRKGIDLVGSALSLLNVKQFYRSIHTVYKKGTEQSWISQIEQ